MALIDYSQVDYLLNLSRKNNKQSLKTLESELRRLRRNAKTQVSARQRQAEKESGVLRDIIIDEKKNYQKEVDVLSDLINEVQRVRSGEKTKMLKS